MTASALPKIEPRTGRKISAVNRDAISTKISVSGRYDMNSPLTPGQSSIGRKAARVVAVEDMMGQNMRDDAEI